MSKTRLFQSIKALNLEAVASVLEARPELKQVKDERGRNALHLLCSLPSQERKNRQSLELAQYLLELGFDINAPAFVEGPAFKATPLWYAISRGRNLPLANLLLKKGSTPEYCLWSAGFHDDVEAVDLLIKSGARVDPVTEDETPFLGAIKWSHFASAEGLLRHGANVNFQNSKGMTALHFLLKKNSDRKHIEMLLRYGADPTLKNADGVSPLDMVVNRRDKTAVKATGGAPVIKTIGLLTRKPGMTHEQFMTHWVEIHAPLAHAVPGLRRYVQSHILEQPTRPDIPTTDIEVDGVAELWYDDRASMTRAHASPEAKALFTDGALFIGRIKSFIVEEKVIIPPAG